MERNKRPFWYALYDSREEITENGLPTGEYVLKYRDPVRSYANISAGSGQAQAEQFGTAINYDRVIVIDDPDFPADENTILFLERPPEKNSDGDWKYDYIVKKAARSLNSVSYAVSRSEVS
jgi:hypothetical protein